MVFAVTDPCRVRAGDRLKGRSAAGVSQRQPMILVVASLNRHKGHAVLLDALPAVLRRHPQVRLILAGDGPEKQSLQSRAEQLGIQASVTLLGYRRDVPDLMRAADLLVLPSLAGEGLPGNAAGCDVCRRTDRGHAIGGSGTSRSERLCGAGRPAAPPGDSNALARALIDALDRPEESARQPGALTAPPRAVVYARALGRGDARSLPGGSRRALRRTSASSRGGLGAGATGGLPASVVSTRAASCAWHPGVPR